MSKRATGSPVWVESKRMDAPKPHATTSPPRLKQGLTLCRSAETTCVLRVVLVVLLLLVLVVMVVVGVGMVEEGGEAIGAARFLVLGVTAAAIVLPAGT